MSEGWKRAFSMMSESNFSLGIENNYFAILIVFQYIDRPDIWNVASQFWFWVSRKFI